MTEVESKEQFLCNPFPATAVARLAKGAREFLNIETEAFKQAKLQVADYLRQKEDNGRTICIVGEYGTGKTHLALSILNAIEENDDETLHPFYLDAPSDNFLELYRKRFLPRLDRRQVLERLDECYADVVAGDLKSDEMYSMIVNKLANREVSAIDVIRKFGLLESKYQRQFQEKLKHITDDPCFSMALTLFQQSEFEEDIWNWLSGKSPTEALKERGIVKTINEDALALEAIGVLAFLFGQQGHRFILLIDELEKVFSSNDNHFPDESAMLAFKKLFETVGKTKALLVLCGLPDYYEALPLDAKQRVSFVLRPSALSGEDVVNYIKKANYKVFNEEILRPFTIDVAKYIATITGGNARMVVRICYHAFQYALNECKEIDRLIVEKIVQEQFGIHTEEDLSAEITQVIERRGWLFETKKIITKNKSKQTADFWMPIANDENGIAITIVKSLLSKDDSKQIIKKSLFFKKEDSKGIKVATVLIIGGYLSDNLKSELNQAFHRVVLYNIKHFKDDLDSVLTGLRIKIEEQSKENDIVQIKEKLGQLDRQVRILSDFIMNDLPTKKELLNSIQYSVSTSLDTLNKKHSFYAMPRKSSAFYPVIARIRELDETIRKTFFDLSFLNLHYNYKFLYDRKTLGYFYLFREIMYIFCNILEYPQKVSTIRTLNIKIDVGEICYTFDTNIIRPLFGVETEIYYGFENMIVKLMECYNDFNRRADAGSMKLGATVEKLIDNIRLLPKKIYNQKRYKRVMYQTDISDMHIIEYDEIDMKEKAKSIYPELNDIFSTISKLISYIDKKIKDLISFLILTRDNNSLSRILEERSFHLVEFYYTKAMTYIFIETVNYNMSSINRFREKDELMELCKLFDTDIFRHSNELRISKIFEIFINNSDDIVSSMQLEEIMIYENRLNAILSELGRKTYRAIDKVYYTYFRRDNIE